MNLLDELRKEETTARPPSRRGTSAYLNERQEERLDYLCAKSGKSRSHTIGRLIDLMYEMTR